MFPLLPHPLAGGGPFSEEESLSRTAQPLDVIITVSLFGVVFSEAVV
jgi:hypothetical protein